MPRADEHTRCRVRGRPSSRPSARAIGGLDTDTIGGGSPGAVHDLGADVVERRPLTTGQPSRMSHGVLGEVVGQVGCGGTEPERFQDDLGDVRLVTPAGDRLDDLTGE